MNEYFKLMIDAKRKNKDSFMYKGTKYVGEKHDKLGMIYRSSKGSKKN